MPISQEFAEAVQDGEVQLARIMLKDSLIRDPSGAEFDEMLLYAQDRIPDLMEEFDGGDLESDTGRWTKDYMNGLKVELMGNFAMERICHLKQVVAYVYKDQLQGPATAGSEAAEKPGRTRAKRMPTGVLLAGVAVAAAGIVLSKPLVVAAGAAMAVAGGAALVASQKGMVRR